LRPPALHRHLQQLLEINAVNERVPDLIAEVIALKEFDDLLLAQASNAVARIIKLRLFL
jgi:hypothetical protein